MPEDITEIGSITVTCQACSKPFPLRFRQDEHGAKFQGCGHCPRCKNAGFIVPVEPEGNAPFICRCPGGIKSA